MKIPGPGLFYSENQKQRTRRSPGRFYFALACIYAISATQVFAQDTLRIDDTTTSASVISSSYYYAESPDDTPADIRLVDEAAWALTEEDQSKLKTETRNIWLRFDLINESVTSEWVLWSRFGWQTHTPIGYCSDDSGNDSGAIHSNTAFEFPIHFGHDSGHKNAFEMTLSGRACRIFVRIETPFSKILNLAVARPAIFWQQSASDQFLHGFLFSCLSIVLALNVLFFFWHRAWPALTYAGALSFFGAWQANVLGYFDSLGFFDPGTDSALIALWATGYFALLLILFWKRLLFLKDYAPGINRFFNFQIVAGLAISIATLIPGAPFTPISLAAKGLFVLIVATFCVAAWVTVRRGFRPAIYSLFGNIIFMLALVVFFGFSTLEFLNASRYIIYLPFAGHLFESVFFLVSLTARQKLLDRVGEDQIIESAIEARASEKRQAQLARLANKDVDALREALVSAMEQDKLYREDLTLASLAKHLNINEKDLSALLNAHFSQSYYSFINSYRVIEASRLLLESPGETILAIGLKVGFKNLSTFNAAFMKQTGMSAGKYRKTKGEPPQADLRSRSI
ncbi:MAG: helix-turn-helix domain-containing protein [bacterium]|nr:helix-turn-helix domain-containing protein [bacterium]